MAESSTQPKFELTTSGLADLDAVTLVLGHWPAETVGETTEGTDDAESTAPRTSFADSDRQAAIGLGLEVDQLVATHKAGAEAGDLFTLPAARADAGYERVLLLGLGDRSPKAYRRAGAALARACRGRDRVAVSVLSAPETVPDAARAFVEGYLLGSYRFGRRSEPKPEPSQQVLLVAPAAPDHTEAVRRATATGAAVRFARDLGNTPSNEKDPAWLADQAAELAETAGLTCRVWDERQLAAGGFGGLVAVGMGSTRPPRLIQLEYAPADAIRHVVLVGKGITYDTGGLSLKPREAMIPMKTDMAGGAAVLAVMGALRELRVPVRVTGLVAAAENMPSGTAQRPGDVLTQYGGTTVEVANTDAEGRLVLADALAYADACLDPDVMVNVATLTGAASLGLGRQYAALFANDDALAADLVAAGTASGDLLWRMPLVEDYRSALDSQVADVCHIGRDAKLSGGAITAALFLREFVGSRPWAHLDIAGPGRSDGENGELTKGSTGFATRALLRWLERSA